MEEFCNQLPDKASTKAHKLDSRQKLIIAEYALEIVRREHVVEFLGSVKSKGHNTDSFIERKLSIVFGDREAKIIYEAITTHKPVPLGNILY
jgi:hypothetical protein